MTADVLADEADEGFAALVFDVGDAAELFADLRAGARWSRR